MYSDGKFYWWVGEGRDPEGYLGPYPTREVALHAGAIQSTMGSITLACADRAYLQADFMAALVAENIAEEILENNEQHINLDSEFSDQWDGAQIARLTEDLIDTVSLWLYRNPPRLRGFGNVLRQEYIVLEPHARSHAIEDLYA